MVIVPRAKKRVFELSRQPFCNDDRVPPERFSGRRNRRILADERKYAAHEMLGWP
jgi:hypothetical protein